MLRADQDASIAHCFKEIGLLCNLEEVQPRIPRSLFNIMKKFNGKPILTRPQHRFYRDAEGKYLLVDLDGHQFNYATRAAVVKGIGCVDWFEMGIGYVVEARKEAEMPERMLSSAKFLKLNLAQAASWPPLHGGGAAGR